MEGENEISSFTCFQVSLNGLVLKVVNSAYGIRVRSFISLDEHKMLEYVTLHAHILVTLKIDTRRPLACIKVIHRESIFKYHAMVLIR